ncbi:MAG: flagellar biosynthesis anti-sigma factor FlgM [Terriglobales bacterium]
MRVEVNGLTGSALDGIKSPERTPAETASAVSAETAVGEDAATLSVDGARVNSLVAKALHAPEIRQDKVEALRQAVQSGEYAIDPAQIAEAMIRQSE